ncbi:MAG TPA: hypothetical protein VEB21_12495 [Terriglobales bacterium]|nr:hypothetical protein [Terriglobales bacterium]
MQISRSLLVLPLAVALLAGCRGDSALKVGESCADVSDKIADQLIEQYPFNRLDDDVRERIKDSWGRSGEVCITSNQVPQLCNAGTMREPKEVSCCHIAAPSLRLTNIPERIEVRDGEGKAALVDLRITANSSNRSENFRCVVPTCEDDSYAADVVIRVEGSVRLEEEAVNLAIDLKIKDRLQQSCTLN